MDAVSSGVSSSFTGRPHGPEHDVLPGRSGAPVRRSRAISPNSVPEHDRLPHVPAPNPFKMVRTILTRIARCARGKCIERSPPPPACNGLRSTAAGDAAPRNPYRPRCPRRHQRDPIRLPRSGPARSTPACSNTATNPSPRCSRRSMRRSRPPTPTTPDTGLFRSLGGPPWSGRASQPRHRPYWDVLRRTAQDAAWSCPTCRDMALATDPALGGGHEPSMRRCRAGVQWPS